MTAARVTSADAVIRRALGPLVDSAEMAEAADLAREAAMVATGYLEGRPLFAAHCTLQWPDESHMVLWHAQMLLREFRGDGHISALTVEGLAPLDVLILHAATGEVSRQGLQLSRRWSDAEWAAGVAALAKRGLVDDEGQFTDAGRKQREWIEERTDALAMAPYSTLGEDRCSRLRALARPFSKAILGLNLFGS